MGDVRRCGGRLSIGDLAMLVAALAATSATLGSMISGGAFTYQALLMFESYREVLSAPPDLPVPDQPVPVGCLRRGIDVDDVWFRYGPATPWILRGVSCFIPRGQATALVGLTERARAPWSSCCAGSTTPIVAGSCGTALTCAT